MSGIVEIDDVRVFPHRERTFDHRGFHFFSERLSPGTRYREFDSEFCVDVEMFISVLNSREVAGCSATTVSRFTCFRFFRFRVFPRGKNNYVPWSHLKRTVSDKFSINDYSINNADVYSHYTTLSDYNDVFRVCMVGDPSTGAIPKFDMAERPSLLRLEYEHPNERRKDS